MNQIVGIDLGTTNSTLAFASEAGTIEQFEIPQRISSNMEAKKKFLPSFYLFPPEEEEPTVGWYAKERAAEIPDRIVASAKSWLCHDLIDRREPFLPIGEFPQKKNPVEICSTFLAHLRLAWEKELNPLSFQDQKVLLTVPASFDPGARSLVQEAALQAGFPEVRLLEEPLAAFYSWLHTYRNSWRDLLKIGDTVLVMDVGGGTTDFSLIAVQNLNGDLSLERKAVGNHLLLGGDNMDLSLAYLAQQKMGQEIDAWQFQSLVHGCRSAKEILLGMNSPESVEVLVQGKSSRVIGGALSVSLKKEEVEKVLIDGFFPKVELYEPVKQEKRSGIAKMGLPFARDPRISAQLAYFLTASKAPLPNVVLFNGGTMKSAAFQQRILSMLSIWKQDEVQLLPGADFDFSVSRGAVFYGWSLENQGIRVKAATCKSYFIGVESSAPAIPGVEPPLKKIRIVPFGMEEGSEAMLHDEFFTLYLEEPAIFRFFCQHSPEQTELTELHPIETVLEAQKEEGKAVLIKLSAKITELGALELWCISEDGRKWKLEFDIRKIHNEPAYR